MRAKHLFQRWWGLRYPPLVEISEREALENARPLSCALGEVEPKAGLSQDQEDALRDVLKHYEPALRALAEE